MAQFAAGLAIAWAPVHSGALLDASNALGVVSAMATAVMAAAPTVKGTAGAL
jgi:hypothetical protein